MAKYSALYQRTASTTLSVGSLTASNATALKRIRLTEVTLGSEDTPGDGVFLWQLQRGSSGGSSSSGGVNVIALDGADASPVSSLLRLFTVDFNYTANAMVLSVPLNQRQTFRWFAAPGQDLILPATNGTGIGIKTPVAATVLVTATTVFEEL